MAQHNLRGSEAENQVANYLKSLGFKIVEQNWKTKWCEIDIVAKKDNCLYFVEVKYRNNTDWGSGFDYITAAKLKKMDLAARSWVEINNWQGEYTLSAAEVAGPNFAIEFIEEV